MFPDISFLAVDYMTLFLHYLCVYFIDAVIWGHASDLVAQAAEENLASVKNELKSNQTKKWQAIGMLKHILSSGNLPWDFKEHAINFLLDITDENISQENGGDHNDFSSYMPSVFAALQVDPFILCFVLFLFFHAF